MTEVTPSATTNTLLTQIRTSAIKPTISRKQVLMILSLAIRIITTIKTIAI